MQLLALGKSLKRRHIPRRKIHHEVIGFGSQLLDPLHKIRHGVFGVRVRPDVDAHDSTLELRHLFLQAILDRSQAFRWLSVALDHCIILGQQEIAGSLVALLGSGRHRADLDVGDAQVKQCGKALCIGVEPRRNADRAGEHDVPEAHPHGVLHPPNITRCVLGAEAPFCSIDDHALGSFRLKTVQHRQDHGVIHKGLAVEDGCSQA
mmetsp:Transcript_17276/g.27440  ORF Transcript_17276/g.27440 Transcript_17276/m.27440 type:complete len:206 (-) Transcript_17276:13-630(-)